MAAEQINAELLAALQWFEQFHRREGEGWTDSFERVAAAFHGDTGYLRPGKDCRVHDSDVRQAAWEKWVAEHVDKARDTIADAIAMSEVRHGGFGMTLRDYLAARAMQAALTNWPADAGDWMRERAELAQRAYAMADAMLEARNA